jgi:hypothetical protein
MTQKSSVVGEAAKNDVKVLILASIISADNDRFTEEQKQEVITRFNEARKTNKYDWDYILEPVDNTNRLAKLFYENE